jgi:spore coat protein CotH
MVKCVGHSLVVLSLGATLACSGATDAASDTTIASVTDSATSSTGPTGTSDTTADDATDAGDSGDSGDSGDDLPPDDGPPPDPNEQIPPPDEDGCHGLYAQDLLPTFKLTIEPVVWELLQDEWNHGQAIEDDGGNPKTYHPLAVFEYGDIAIYDAEIRLRGNATHWDPIPDDKMQFQIGFHRNDEDGRFLGIKRLGLDAATANRHLLRDRLALKIMRDVGIVAPCANNARVVINGEYYGIFTNIEKIDETFLERHFDDPTGDLWKRAHWTLKTNEETSNDDRVEELNDAETVEELYTYLDLEQALRVFAAEAVLPFSDGMWAGGLNFYVYDEPISGKFMMLTWDLDNTFERFHDDDDGEYPHNPDPVVWEKWTSHGRPFYEIALEDPMWFDYYIQQVGEVFHEGYQPEKLHELIDTYTAQIEDAVLSDTNKPWTNKRYMDEVELLHWYVQQRAEWLEEWLECWEDGGVNDGEGYCEEP